MSRLRTLLLNRFCQTLLAFALIVGALNLYVAYHDDGILSGNVVGPDGRPLPNAEVTLYMPALIGLEKIESLRTDKSGRFRFTHHGQHHPALQVRLDGYVQSDLHRVRLYFRNQNRDLVEPIVIQPVS